MPVTGLSDRRIMESMVSRDSGSKAPLRSLCASAVRSPSARTVEVLDGSAGRRSQLNACT
jgi:hypothetical protein